MEVLAATEALVPCWDNNTLLKVDCDRLDSISRTSNEALISCALLSLPEACSMTCCLPGARFEVSIANLHEGDFQIARLWHCCGSKSSQEGWHRKYQSTPTKKWQCLTCALTAAKAQISHQPDCEGPWSFTLLISAAVHDLEQGSQIVPQAVYQVWKLCS